MLEWLKGILGDSYTDDIDKAISAEIGKGFVSRADFNTVNEAKKSLESQVGDFTKQLEELKKADPKELEAQIEQLKADNANATQKLNDTIASLKLSSAVDVALAQSGARNSKTLKALIDMEKVKLDGDTLVGLSDQITAIKESDGYLFDSDKSWGQRHGSGSEPTDGVERAFLARNPNIKI